MRNTTLGHHYADGEIIIKQGDEGNCLFVIQEGNVGVYRENHSQETKIAELGQGEFF